MKEIIGLVVLFIIIIACIIWRYEVLIHSKVLFCGNLEQSERNKMFIADVMIIACSLAIAIFLFNKII
jgi:hypothetical protein